MSDYLTPDELRITQAEFDGLIQIKALFEGKPKQAVPVDELTHIEHPRNEKVLKISDELGFGMDFGAAIVDLPEVYHCGCAACIGGHLSLAMQGVDIQGREFSLKSLQNADEYVIDHEYHRTLGKLFYPHIIKGREWNKITPGMAAEAIENLLTTGAPKWGEIAERHDLAIDEDESA